MKILNREYGIEETIVESGRVAYSPFYKKGYTKNYLDSEGNKSDKTLYESLIDAEYGVKNSYHNLLKSFNNI